MKGPEGQGRCTSVTVKFVSTAWAVKSRWEGGRMVLTFLVVWIVRPSVYCTHTLA